MSVWAEEQEAAAERNAGHWQEVRSKQRRAAELRIQLGAAQRELQPLDAAMQADQARLKYLKSKLSQANDSLQELREQLPHAHCLWCATRELEVSEQEAAVDTARGQVDDLSPTVASQVEVVRGKSKQVEDLQQRLRSAEASPEAVWQPLPADKNRALAVLFFFFAPHYWSALARMAFLAQEQLLPRPWADPEERWDVEPQIKAAPDDTWLGYYSSRQHSQYAPGAKLAAGAKSWVAPKLQYTSHVPTTIGPRHVDALTSPSDGVWHPDSLLPSLAWAGPTHQAPIQ